MIPTRAPRVSLHKSQGWCSGVQNPPAPAGEGPQCASLSSSLFIAMSVVHSRLWQEYFHPSKHYKASPHLPVLLSRGLGPHSNPVLGLQPHLKGMGQVLALPEGREWQPAVLPSLPLSQEPWFLTSPFPLVSPQDAGSLDEKMKSLDVNGDSELRFNEYWRLIGELAKEIRKEKEAQKKAGFLG